MTDLFGDEMQRNAEVSDCGLYRYVLTRKWAEGPMVTFVMFNPSTADADIDDPTVRRCIDFAKREGFGELAIVNLTPHRATNPRELLDVFEYGGSLLCYRNGVYVRLMAERSEKVVVAWGAWGDRFPWLVERATELVGEGLRCRLKATEIDLWCLGTTKSGQPRHPLYLKKTTPLVRWEAPDA